MSWARVDAWIRELRALDPAELSEDGPEAARAAWKESLDALNPVALAAAAAIEGAPYKTATFVSARTVFTAPIEWCALLLGHGTRVRIKHPRGRPGSARVLAQTAQRVGLPLEATEDRGATRGAELVIAMGSDETVEALRQTLAPGTDALLFGHRFSAAWLDDPRSATDVADALWPFDSRGCMSPQVVFTPLPLPAICEALATELTAFEARYPRGQIGAGEGARIRARGALARITGVRIEGAAWAVHGLQARHWHPESLPRCVAVVSVPDRAAAQAILAPWSRWLSTVGDEGAEAWFGAQVCPIRQLQRPPLDRLHDGVPLLRSVVRPR